MATQKPTGRFVARQDPIVPLAPEALQEIKVVFGVAGEVRAIASAPGYAVSDDGRVFSAAPCSWRSDRIREVRPIRHQYGYRNARLHIDKRATLVGIHRLVAEAFLPQPQVGENVVRHLNGDPADNRVANLAWGTQADNIVDAIRHGNTLKGMRSPQAKLNDRRVRIIRDLCDEGFSPRVVACFFGVSHETVRRAINKETWGHVK